MYQVQVNSPKEENQVPVKKQYEWYDMFDQENKKIGISIAKK